MVIAVRSDKSIDAMPSPHDVLRYGRLPDIDAKHEKFAVESAVHPKAGLQYSCLESDEESPVVSSLDRRALSISSANRLESRRGTSGSPFPV
jgi:hypothetical protein